MIKPSIPRGATIWPGGDAVSIFGATVRCDLCGIFIGRGHTEQHPRRRGAAITCGACYQASGRELLQAPEERTNHRTHDGKTV